jgi:hypothetical protein
LLLWQRYPQDTVAKLNAKVLVINSSGQTQAAHEALRVALVAVEVAVCCDTFAGAGTLEHEITRVGQDLVNASSHHDIATQKYRNKAAGGLLKMFHPWG